MCEDKRRFAREGEAVTRAAELAARGLPMRVYACPHCGGFHLTSRRKMA